jgi:hypothetical protein
VLIAALVLVWLVALFYRHELRSHWWAYRLQQADDPLVRAYYLPRLAAMGEHGLGALDRLLRDPRPQNREAGVAVLHYCTSEEARERLLHVLLNDPDESVAEKAALELALRKDALRSLDDLDDVLFSLAHPTRSRRAAVAIERIGGAEAKTALLEALLTHGGRLDADVCAQVIDSLAMLGSEDAVPAIRDALADDRGVTILPASQRAAQRAVMALQGDLTRKGVDPGTLLEASTAAPTVAAVAQRALTLLNPSPTTAVD